MTELEPSRPITRRRALALGGGLAAGLLAPGIAGGSAAQAAPTRRGRSGARSSAALPSARMQEILQAEGSVSNGVLHVSVDRDDIHGVTLRGVPIAPAFQLNGDLAFQSLGAGQALFNGDIPLKSEEVNPVIDAILANGLVFQAEHQHFYDFDPPVWFIHFRGRRSPLALAQAVRNVLGATSTPLPQKMPSNLTTPLDKERLRKILRGDAPEVAAGGVVTVSVSRRDRILLGGVGAEPDLNIATTVAFQPLDAAGSTAAAAPDFALETAEVDRVMRTMRGAGWDIGCLYNQEIGEQPQLYFSHQFKTGDPYVLAREVRRGLDHTNTA